MRQRAKQVAFFCGLATLVVAAAALSFYKVAIANAYRTFPDLPDVSEQWLGDRALTDAPGEAQVARGRWLMSVVGCRDCHGSGLAGAVLSGDSTDWILTAPALAGPRARTTQFAPEDWRQALRLGVDGERRGLWGMPRRALLALRDRDVAALAAAVRTAPEPAADAANDPLPHSRLWPRGYLAVALRTLWPLDRDSPAEAHARGDWLAGTPDEDDAALGPYLAAVAHCESCHRFDSARRVSSVWRDRRGPPLATVLGTDVDEDARQRRWQAHACATHSAVDGRGPPSIHRASLFTCRQQHEIFAALERALAGTDKGS